MRRRANGETPPTPSAGARKPSHMGAAVGEARLRQHPTSVHSGLRALKARGRTAECMRVPPLRKRLASVLVLLLLVAPALTGCAMPAGSARAQAGVAGEILEQLKREDDEIEGEERAAMRQADEERHEEEAEREIEWH